MVEEKKCMVRLFSFSIRGVIISPGSFVHFNPVCRQVNIPVVDCDNRGAIKYPRNFNVRLAKRQRMCGRQNQNQTAKGNVNRKDELTYREHKLSQASYHREEETLNSFSVSFPMVYSQFLDSCFSISNKDGCKGNDLPTNDVSSEGLWWWKWIDKSKLEEERKIRFTTTIESQLMEMDDLVYPETRTCFAQKFLFARSWLIF